MADLFPWVVVLCSALICYGWRAMGVFLSHGLDSDGAAVRWLTCVGYAMLAAVAARMIALPTGALAEVPDTTRYAACAAALAVFLLRRKGVFSGTAAGFTTLIALNFLLGTSGAGWGGG